MNAVTSVSADEYLRQILEREAVDASARSPLRALGTEVAAFIRRHAGNGLFDLYPIGGFERGTANRSGRSIDFLASFSPQVTAHAGDIYERLFDLLARHGHEPERRHVSISFKLKDAIVDLVPGKREAMTTDVHELWLDPLQRPIKTNPTQHILDIAASGRREEIRIIKIWRDQVGLDFPGFYLELSVLAALRRRPQGPLADDVWAVFGYLEGMFPARSILDPVNANNIVSDQLSAVAKDAIRKAAQVARGGRAWSEIIR